MIWYSHAQAIMEWNIAAEIYLLSMALGELIDMLRKGIANSTANEINAAETQRQALRPNSWKTRPDKNVPIKRPAALAI